MFWLYNKVGDSDDVVIEKQVFSIVGTHGPATATPLLSFCFHSNDSPHPHRNQIFPVGCHRGVFRFVRPGLHHITSSEVIAGCRATKAYVDFDQFVSPEPGNDSLPSSLQSDLFKDLWN